MSHKPYIQHNRFKAALLGATMLIGGHCGLAYAQDAAPAPAEAGDETVVVVTGFKKSYADAVRAKRSVVEVTDSISSDGLGRFPDLNVGEAVQRIPGVQINREAEGRNATINLRGLPGEYAKLTMNGVAFAEPILGEAAPLGAYNSDIFSGVSIQKSPTAALQSGGLSGNIDLQIAPALSRKDGGSFKVGYEHNALGELGSPSVTIGYNKHLSADLAVFGIVAFKEEKFRRDSIINNNYVPLKATTTPNFSRFADYYAPTPVSGPCPTGQVCTPTGTGLKGKTGVLFVSQPRQIVRYNEGELVTAAGGFEYKANENLKVGATGFYTERTQDGTTQNIQIVALDNAFTVVNPTSPIVTMADGRFMVEKYNFSNAEVVASERLLPQRQASWGLNGNAEWKNEKWRLASVLTVSKAENSSVETQIDFGRPPTSAGNGTSGNYYSGSGDIANYDFNLTPASPFSVAGATWTWGGVSDPTSYYDAATSAAATRRIGLTGTQSYATNKLNAAQGDIERYIDNGFFNSVQFGMRYEQNEFISEGYRTSAAGIQIQNADANFLSPSPYISDFFGGEGGNFNKGWQKANLEYAAERFKPVIQVPGGDLSPLGYNIRYDDSNYALFNFTNETDILATYIQAKFDTDLLGIRVRGNAGLRYETAENTITALDRKSVAPGQIAKKTDFVTNTYDNEYDYLLPSFAAVADLTDTLVLRGAAYKTYVRPHPRQFSPITIVGTPNNSNVFTVNIGNKDLKPYEATSYDLSLEWYNRPNGLVALAIFQKNITDLIAPLTSKAALCPSDASAWGLGTLTLEGDTCYSNLPVVNGNRAVVLASGNYNSPNEIKVSGVEFNIQQNLDFLPAPFDKLGGAMNYAYTTVDGKASNGTTATLVGISENNLNLIGYYETAKYGVRLVYNYRDEYDLTSGGTFSGSARRSVKARGQFDASVSYTVTDNLSLSFDAFNLTDEVRYEYEGQETMPRRADYDGRTYQLTARATF